jgi:1-acyl-sn-glycerol-3-phosphate acyltransferase
LKSVRTVLSWIYIIWVSIVFTVFMILYLPGMVIPFLLGQRFGWLGYKFIWIWAWTFSMLTFIRYEFKGRENFQKHSSIFICNHTSFLDLPGLRLIIPGEFKPLAKKELRKIPIFKWILETATVVVDRSSNESRKKSIDQLKNALSRGISILIFAEGTQNRTQEVLQPFHDGAFRIAIDTQRPLLPMVVIGAGKLMPPGRFYVAPGKIKIVVEKEIQTEGLTVKDIPALKEKVFNLMKEMILCNQY